jgi:hypothetical protein
MLKAKIRHRAGFLDSKLVKNRRMTAVGNQFSREEDAACTPKMYMSLQVQQLERGNAGKLRNHAA